MRARDIMTTEVVTVGPTTPVKAAAALLVERGISAVPVVDEDGALLGIVSEADLVGLETDLDPRAHVIPPSHHERYVPATVQEIMTREVVAASEDADAAELARLMLERRVKRIPIVSGNRVVGIVSRRDLLRVLARSDEAIRGEVEELLDDEILMIGRFAVEVSNGVVGLTGPHDPASRRLAELLARSVPGVLAVRFADGDPASPAGAAAPDEDDDGDILREA